MSMYEAIKQNIGFICGWLVGAGTVGEVVILKYFISEFLTKYKEKKNEKSNECIG